MYSMYSAMSFVSLKSHRNNSPNETSPRLLVGIIVPKKEIRERESREREMEGEMKGVTVREFTQLINRLKCDIMKMPIAGETGTRFNKNRQS